MPWDYCCEPKENLAQATVFVKFVDEHGGVLRGDPQSLLGVQELSTVIVKGKAQRDSGENLNILASQIHVKRE